MSSVKIQGSATGTANFTIAVPDGTSTDRTINLPDAAGSFVLADGSNNVAVTGDLTVDTDTLYVDATNNRVGVGTASPSATLEALGGQLRIGASTAGSMFLVNPSTTYSDGVDLQATYNGAGSYGPLKFSTGGSERARISDGGNFFVGATAAFNNNVDSGVEIRPASLRIGSNQFVDNIMCCTAHTGTKYFLSFYQNGTFVGSITGNGSNTAFNTSSDYRLKENVVDLDGAIDRVKQIPVRQFNFIDKPDRTVDGFLAHEVQAVVPEAVTGTKDEVNDDGNPVYQGIDQSKLVPLLTQALKDAITKIEALETRVAALEAV